MDEDIKWDPLSKQVVRKLLYKECTITNIALLDYDSERTLNFIVKDPVTKRTTSQWAYYKEHQEGQLSKAIDNNFPVTLLIHRIRIENLDQKDIGKRVKFSDEVVDIWF